MCIPPAIRFHPVFWHDRNVTNYPIPIHVDAFTYINHSTLNCLLMLLLLLLLSSSSSSSMSVVVVLVLLSCVDSATSSLASFYLLSSPHFSLSLSFPFSIFSIAFSVYLIFYDPILLSLFSLPASLLPFIPLSPFLFRSFSIAIRATFPQSIRIFSIHWSSFFSLTTLPCCLILFNIILFNLSTTPLYTLHLGLTLSLCCIATHRTRHVCWRDVIFVVFRWKKARKKYKTNSKHSLETKLSTGNWWWWIK